MAIVALRRYSRASAATLEDRRRRLLCEVRLVTGSIELYEDRRSGWRVLTSRGGTMGYRFLIVDRAGRSTFAGDAMELASGKVPAGLEQVDLEVDSPHGMVLTEPCAVWSRGRVRRTETRPGVLTAAYITGEVAPGVSAGPTTQGPQDRVSVDDDVAQPDPAALAICSCQSVEAEPLGGQHLPGASSNGSTARRHRRTAQRRDARLVVTRITQLVAANEDLQRANRELIEENQRLRGELTAIGFALGSLTGRHGSGGGGALALPLPEARSRRQRRPITDPETRAARNAGLARARAARAEKLAAAKAAPVVESTLS